MRTRLTAIFMVAFFMFFARVSEIRAANFTVNTFDDPAPVAAPNGCTTGGRCSLREAALSVNNNTEPDTIILGEGTYNLTIPEAGTPETGDLDFNGPAGIFAVTIQGVSPDKTIINAAAGLNERLMDFSGSDATATLSNLTIQNGNSPGSGGGISFSSGASLNPDPINVLNCNFLNNHAQGTGGGASLGGSHPTINVDGGTYSGNVSAGNGGALALQHGAPNPEISSVQNIIVTDNHTQQGNGGGIFFSASSSIRFTNVQVTQNQALNPADTAGQGLGGGIYFSDGGTIAGEILDSVVADNTADGESGSSNGGGGAYASGSGVVRVSNSTFSGNKALNNFFGGGIFVSNGGGVEITASTFSGNSAGSGGGAFISGASGTLKEITNSTFSNNQATGGGGGGGIWVDRSDGLSLNNDTIAQNTAAAGNGGGIVNDNASVTIQNSIFSANDNAGQAGDCIGIFHSAGYNIFASPQNGDCEPDGTNAGTGPNDSAADPLLGQLADNGGPTLTYALLAGSPAIDGGNPAGCKNGSGANLTTDQRGQTRPLGPRCDIGAVEQGSADLQMTKTADASAYQVGDDITYTLTVKNNGPDDDLGVSVSDTLPGNVTFVSASSNCSEANGTVDCDIGPLNSGASASVTITVATTITGNVTNAATANGKELDPEPNNNTSSVTVSVDFVKVGGGCRLAENRIQVPTLTWAGFALGLMGAWGLRRRTATRRSNQ